MDQNVENPTSNSSDSPEERSWVPEVRLMLMVGVAAECITPEGAAAIMGETDNGDGFRMAIHEACNASKLLSLLYQLQPEKMPQTLEEISQKANERIARGRAERQDIADVLDRLAKAAENN